MAHGVWVGRNIGVYTSWDDCKEQVDGYSGAKYRKIKACSLEEANKNFLNGYLFLDCECSHDY